MNTLSRVSSSNALVPYQNTLAPQGSTDEVELTVAELEELDLIEATLDQSADRAALSAQKTARSFAEFQTIVEEMMNMYERNILDMEVCVIESESQLREREKLHKAEVANYTKKIQENEAEITSRNQQMALDAQKSIQRYNEIIAKQQKIADVAVQAIKKAEETTIALEKQKAATRLITLRHTLKDGLGVAISMIDQVINTLQSQIASNNITLAGIKPLFSQINAAKVYIEQLALRVEKIK